MNWGFLENILSGVNKYSTAIGRVWLSVVFLFRILVYVTAAEQVWKDETKDFVCNTRQPGCETACFDRLFPVSMVRLWAVQLILVSTPSLLVALHVAYREHREAKHKKKLYKDRATIDGGLFFTYVASLLFKTAFEVATLLVFYRVYGGFELPVLHRCEQSPCPNTVDCFVGKATEKKIFLYIMACASVLCIVLNAAELAYITWKQVVKHVIRHYAPAEKRPASRVQAQASSVDRYVSVERVANEDDGPTKAKPLAENLPVQSETLQAL